MPKRRLTNQAQTRRRNHRNAKSPLDRGAWGDASNRISSQPRDKKTTDKVGTVPCLADKLSDPSHVAQKRRRSSSCISSKSSSRASRGMPLLIHYDHLQPRPPLRARISSLTPLTATRNKSSLSPSPPRQTSLSVAMALERVTSSRPSASSSAMPTLR
jgi:hypothetical protein